MKVLDTPWRWSFFVFSMLARIPLSAVSVIVLVGFVDAGRSVGEGGLAIGAVALGAGLAGLIQGPAWDRFDNGRLYLLLSIAAALALAGLAFLPAASSDAFLALAAVYGLLRPQTSTVVRSAWIEEFPDSSELSGRAVSLDISWGAVLTVAGPILAGGLFALLGYRGAMVAVALIGLVCGLALGALLLRGRKASEQESSSLLHSARAIFTNSPLVAVIGLSFLVSCASGAFSVLLAARLAEGGHSGWLGPLLALNALGIILGSIAFRRIARAPGSYMHLLLVGEAAGLAFYGAVFLLPEASLWLLAPVGAVFVAPLSTALYLVVESRSRETERASVFSLLASASFVGASVGQSGFSQLADLLGSATATFVGAGIVFLVSLIWMSMPYGMRRYRPRQLLCWWPEDLDSRLESIDGKTNTSQTEREYRQIISFVSESLSAGIVPDLPRTLLKREELPGSATRLAKMAWTQAWEAGMMINGTDDIVACGRWYERNGYPEDVLRSVASHFGFQYRHYAHDPRGPLPDGWEEAGPLAREFYVLCNASIYRSGRRYLTLLDWLRRPEFSAETDNPSARAMECLARWALGERPDPEEYRDLSRQLPAGGNIFLLDGLCLAMGSDRELAEWLALEVEEFERNFAGMTGTAIASIFRARALRVLGKKKDAYREVMKAYEQLPYREISDSNALFIEQLDLERNLILLLEGDFSDDPGQT